MKTLILTLDSFEEEKLINLSKKKGFEDIESFIESLIKFEYENQCNIRFLRNLEEELLVMKDSTIFNLLSLIEIFNYRNISKFMLIELEEIFEEFIFQNQKDFLIKKDYYDFNKGEQYYKKIR